MILKPDDFEIGMYITVLDNLPYKKEGEVFDSETSGISIKTITNQDRSGMGSVLEIISINLPYIVCKNYDTYGNYNNSWDTRRTRFISLASDYVKALIGLEVKKDDS